MLYGHLSSLGSYTSTNARGFLVAGCGAVPGAVWGVLGTMAADVCPCCRSPVVHAALVWLCPGTASAVQGGMWCHVRRTEQGWGGINFFFPDNLFLPRDTLCSFGDPKALGLWMTLCLHCHIKLGFEHTEAQTPLLSTPFTCWLWLCTGSSKEKEEEWGGTGSVWLWLTPPSTGSRGAACWIPAFPGHRWQRHKKQN